SIIREVARDITGATKTTTALALSPFDMLGAEVPIAFEDLTTRDWVGAASVASMFVGGALATGAKSVLAGQGLKAIAPGAGREAAREAAKAWAKRAGPWRNAAMLAST